MITAVIAVRAAELMSAQGVEVFGGRAKLGGCAEVAASNHVAGVTERGGYCIESHSVIDLTCSSFGGASQLDGE